MSVFVLTAENATCNSQKQKIDINSDKFTLILINFITSVNSH